MKYKIHDKYEGEEFWTRTPLPDGYKKARSCDNCAKALVVAYDCGGKKMVCTEVTEFTGLWNKDVPMGYSRQPTYTYEKNVCPKHKFNNELEKDENEN